MIRLPHTAGSPARRSGPNWSGPSSWTTRIGRWSRAGVVITTGWDSPCSSGRPGFSALSWPTRWRSRRWSWTTWWASLIPRRVVSEAVCRAAVNRVGARGEIRQAYSYRDIADDRAQHDLRAFIDARAWTRTEGPRALFDQAVAWLRRRRCSCPGRASWPGWSPRSGPPRRTASTRSSPSAAAAVGRRAAGSAGRAAGSPRGQPGVGAGAAAALSGAGVGPADGAVAGPGLGAAGDRRRPGGPSRESRRTVWRRWPDTGWRPRPQRCAG